MDQMLHGVPPTSCLNYLDDLIVYGRSFSEVPAHLEQVLQKLERAGLKLNPKKCHLFQRKVDYLGHVISAKGVATDPKKIEAVTKWPQPASKTDVRSFLGLCSYYRRFVPSFADVARPLHVLTEERSPFLWTNSCQQVFEALKTQNRRYRRFVSSFADMARPLHVLTEERSPFLWKNSCQQAFEALKTV